MDAAVRSSVNSIQCAGFEGFSPRVAAIIKVLHHYNQFTMRRVGWRLRLVLLRAAGGGRGGRAESVQNKVIRLSVGPLERCDDFRSRGRRSSLGHFTEVLKVSGGFGRLTLFFDPPPVFLLLLLQVLQTLSDRRAAQTHESSELCDEFVLRRADATVRRRDRSQLTFEFQFKRSCKFGAAGWGLGALRDWRFSFQG